MKHENIANKFTQLYTIICSRSFLQMEALGGEIPFFISTYHPGQEIEVTKAIQSLKNKLENEGIAILEINVYDIALEILDKELGLDEMFTIEREMNKSEFKDALQSVLDINEVLMPTIKEKIGKYNAEVYFLTGIGHVFPFIRSHNILNNLQNIATEAPTVMFFPGIYNGQSLELFGKLKDDNYYRAFNLDNYKI